MKTILLLILVIISILIYKYMLLEEWVPYRTCPFGNIETAPNSQVYYVNNRYRKPLYWPFKYNSSYPMKHKRHLD